jgi:hypothetical protein
MAFLRMDGNGPEAISHGILITIKQIKWSGREKRNGNEE